jgi:serine/threonine protein kinase
VELKEGALIADRFRLIRLLGQGGMGEVWAAQHASLDIPCAVKFIHAESAAKPEVRVRFEREAKAAAQLRSPNVVQILDYGIFENTPYIAMEYLEGEPLNARLKRRERLDPHETFRIVRDVAKALGKAHQAGIVHRDLKPENVFLVPDEDREVAKVLDFGVAKSADQLDSNTRTGALLGTPYFMSPEQAQGTKAVDHRADLWSLAVVTYRCLTGELPFTSTALGDLLIKIVTHPLPVPSRVRPGLPDGFDAWWARAAQRDPGHRYQNAREFTESLGMALNVSMPSALGNTPMPGVLTRDLAPRGVGQTVIAEPHLSGSSPSHGQHGHGQHGHGYPSHGHQSHPQHGYTQQGYAPAQSAQSHGGYPPAPAGYPSAPQPYAQPFNESQGLVGVATPTRVQPRSGKGPVIGVLVGLLAIAGAAGAFFMLRSAPVEAPPPEPAAAQPKTPAPPASSPAAQPPPPTPDPVPDVTAPEPEDTSAPVRPGPKGPRPPSPVPVTPTPVPPSPVPPTPVPPTPKPPNPDDPGF